MQIAPADKRTLATRLYRELIPAFDALDRWAAAEIPSIAGYPAEAVRRRVLQRAAELAVRPLLERLSRAETSDLLETAGDCGGVGIKGRVTVSPAFFAKACAAFFAHWASAFACFFKTGRDPRPCAVLFGVGSEPPFEDGSDAGFVDFLRKGPIEPLSRAPRVLVEHPNERPSPTSADVAYHPRLLQGLHASLPRPGFAETLEFAERHIRNLIAYGVALGRQPALCLIGKDIAYEALAFSLNRRGAIASVCITNSDYDSQPLWMADLPGRRFETSILWYSTNMIHHVYKDQPVFAMQPQYRYLKVDRSWAWSPEHVQELEQVGIRAPQRVVGPLVWRLERRRPKPAEGRRRVGLFDVTPVSAEWAKTHGVPYNYYSPETASAFLRDAVAACRAAGAEALLKPKRVYGPIHDAGYVALVRELADEGALTLVGAEGSDLFGFISTLDLAVVAPWSSPAHIARHLGVRSLYYDATGLLTTESPLIKSPIVRSAEELAIIVQGLNGE